MVKRLRGSNIDKGFCESTEVFWVCSFQGISLGKEIFLPQRGIKLEDHHLGTASKLMIHMQD